MVSEIDEQVRRHVLSIPKALEVAQSSPHCLQHPHQEKQRGR